MGDDTPNPLFGIASAEDAPLVVVSTAPDFESLPVNADMKALHQDLVEAGASLRAVRRTVEAAFNLHKVNNGTERSGCQKQTADIFTEVQQK